MRRTVFFSQSRRDNAGHYWKLPACEKLTRRRKTSVVSCDCRVKCVAAPVEATVIPTLASAVSQASNVRSTDSSLTNFHAGARATAVAMSVAASSSTRREWKLISFTLSCGWSWRSARRCRKMPQQASFKITQSGGRKWECSSLSRRKRQRVAVIAIIRTAMERRNTVPRFRLCHQWCRRVSWGKSRLTYTTHTATSTTQRRSR